MYFSLEPKKRRENLYDREKELRELKKAEDNGKIVLIEGIRRIGKTSLLQVFLEQKRLDGNLYIFLDCRSLLRNNRISKQSFEFAFTDAIKKALGVSNILRNILDSISKVNIKGVEIDFKGKKNHISDIFSVLDTIDLKLKKLRKKLIIAFDESQNLRFYGKGGGDILNLLAHSYDHLQNISFILSGSEVGLLHDFLKLNDPKTPLFGRYIQEINIERFTKERSINFLTDGFKQVNVTPKMNKIEKAVESLDGIVGYLTIYGFIVYSKGNWDNALEESVKMAEELVRKEIYDLKKRSENYICVLKASAFGLENFSNIKKYIENQFEEISDQTLSNILSSLVKQSFLEYEYIDGSKIYKIPDPIVKKVALSL